VRDIDRCGQPVLTADREAASNDLAEARAVEAAYWADRRAV
jgi:hypothetical protein